MRWFWRSALHVFHSSIALEGKEKKGQRDDSNKGHDPVGNNRRNNIRRAGMPARKKSETVYSPCRGTVKHLWEAPGKTWRTTVQNAE